MYKIKMENKEKFRGKCIEQYETSHETIEIGDWVYGYYYFDKGFNNGVIVTELSAESGGLGSGLVSCHIKVDKDSVEEIK